MNNKIILLSMTLLGGCAVYPDNYNTRYYSNSYYTNLPSDSIIIIDNNTDYCRYNNCNRPYYYPRDDGRNEKKNMRPEDAPRTPPSQKRQFNNQDK